MDAFKTLGIGRAAAIDVQELESSFHEQSKRHHPDVEGGDGAKFEEVNAAFGKLRTVAGRLKHLRELEFPDEEARRSGAMDPELMDLFARMSRAVQKAEAVANELAAAQSGLAKALMADAIWEARDGLEVEGREISDRLKKLGAGLEGIDAHLAAGERAAALELLDRRYPTAAFLEKWQSQVREKLLGLVV